MIATRHFADAELEALSNRFETAEPAAIIRWAIETFGDGVAVGASFGGVSGMAILHMAAQIKPDIGVFVVDTGYLFEETHETLRQTRDRLGLTGLDVYRTPVSHEEQAQRYGAALWMRDPDLCCEIRKVEPNRQALADRTAWLSGLRRDQSDGRAEIPIVAWNDRFGVVKVNPLANWDEKQVWAYVIENGMPYNPLLDHGYTSIGCYNCTIPGKRGRAGRWEGFEKDECGLHT